VFLGDDAAATSATLGTQVDEMVGRDDGVRIVPDDEHGGAERDEPAEVVEESSGVPRMQSNGRPHRARRGHR